MTSHAHRDHVDRDELPTDAHAVADTLDEWNHRAHGITSSAHHAGLFLDLLADRGYRITPVETSRWSIEARVSPDGFVAQRMTLQGEPRWILSYLTEAGFTVREVDEAEAADWPPVLAVPDAESEAVPDPARSSSSTDGSPEEDHRT
jgi:hypothetical protein